MQAPVQPAPKGQTDQGGVRPQDLQRLMEALLPPTGTRPRDDALRGADGDLAPRQAVVTRSAPGTPQRAVLTGDQFAALPAERQRRLLLLAVLSLEEELETMQDTDTWREQLATRALQRAIACDETATPSVETRRLLRMAADRFDESAGNANERELTGSWEFQTLRNGLREYAVDPVERQKVVLRASIGQLRLSLDRLKTGAQWKEHLKLDDLQRIVGTKQDLTSADHDVLKEIVERMKQVDSDPEYRIVSAAMGFAATRDALEKLAKPATGVLQLVEPEPDSVLQLVESNSGSGVLQLIDQETVRKKIEALFGDLDEPDRRRVQEVIEGLFRDVLKPPTATIMQFEDNPQPPAATLLQFQDNPPPPAATLLQFQDDPKPDESPADDGTKPDDDQD